MPPLKIVRLSKVQDYHLLSIEGIRAVTSYSVFSVENYLAFALTSKLEHGRQPNCQCLIEKVLADNFKSSP